MRPSTDSYPVYFNNYIKLVRDPDVMHALKIHGEEANLFFGKISEGESHYKYQEDKWSIKEMVQHIIDTERIFCFRALVFARHESQALPGFDENKYAQVAHADKRKWSDLLMDLQVTRANTLSLFKSFNEDNLAQSGVANNYSMSVNALGYTIAGHSTHNIGVVKERYLPSLNK